MRMRTMAAMKAKLISQVIDFGFFPQILKLLRRKNSIFNFGKHSFCHARPHGKNTFLIAGMKRSIIKEEIHNPLVFVYIRCIFCNSFIAAEKAFHYLNKMIGSCMHVINGHINPLKMQLLNIESKKTRGYIMDNYKVVQYG